MAAKNTFDISDGTMASPKLKKIMVEYFLIPQELKYNFLPSPITLLAIAHHVRSVISTAAGTPTRLRPRTHNAPTPRTHIALLAVTFHIHLNTLGSATERRFKTLSTLSFRSPPPYESEFNNDSESTNDTDGRPLHTGTKLAFTTSSSSAVRSWKYSLGVAADEDELDVVLRSRSRGKQNLKDVDPVLTIHGMMSTPHSK
ncbi:hypothetical protein C8R45DRAFT_1098501 [Mycena sanguinolenta]|nr:hypothetical protein C8R45DRAFT_1098501 [Mycena sanguinolenta]